jgi:predicted metal-dependent peptidase|tara:strand:+ start:22820 stop:24142 length:1323 start_codon:yes stop_codon:yes gene_type:complete
MSKETLEEVELISKEKFDKIMLKFLIDEPFFSDIMRYIRKEMTDKIPTAGVLCKDDTIVMYWNPKFVSKLPVRHMFGLLKHECYHLIYQHCTSRKQEPHLMWNIATDLAINCTLLSSELPDGGLVPGKIISTPEDTSHLPAELLKQSQKLSDFIASLPSYKSAEWYMETIMNNDEIQKVIQDTMGQKSIMVGKPGDGEGEGQQGTTAGFDYHFDTESMEEGDKALIDAKVKDIIAKATKRADRTESWGSVSSETRAQIRSMMHKEIDWKTVLRYFCGTKQRANRSRSFRKINRKYPYIHPGRKTSHTSNIVIYIDQSGSVGDDDLELLFGTLNDLASRVTFTCYHFDTSVDNNSKYIWKKNKKVDRPYRTRSGGTCFNAAEDHYRKISGEYDGYIVMTDGYAPKPKTCISKRCWVLLPGIKPSFLIDSRDTVVLMEQNKT